MRKVAIVGVEGAGKTVMLAGLGELCKRPDEHGYFLSPKNYSTFQYVREKIEKMKTGQWPTATPEDLMQGLDWTLKKQIPNAKPIEVCSLSCLDFAGEVYRGAFCAEYTHEESEEEKSLKQYIHDCDDLIVLINLKDVITNGLQDGRVRQSMWITNAILEYALECNPKGKAKRAAIVLSQADSYRSTIESCGGAVGVLQRYLPYVANEYDWLDIFDVSTVDRVITDDDGNACPPPDFQLTPLKPIMEWIYKGAEKHGGSELKREHSKPVYRAIKSAEPRKIPEDNGVKKKSKAQEVGEGLGGLVMLVILIIKIMKGCSS